MEMVHEVLQCAVELVVLALAVDVAHVVDDVLVEHRAELLVLHPETAEEDREADGRLDQATIPQEDKRCDHRFAHDGVQ